MASKTKFMVTGALIAAIYALSTYIISSFGLAFGSIQLRISEALTVLAVFTPAAIPGLAIGCFFANIGSGMALDTLIGTLATLIAAILSFISRKITFKGLPLLSFFYPVIINALFVGAELAVFFLSGTGFFIGFLISFLEIFISQSLVCFGLGIPLYCLLCKHKKMLFWGL